MDCLCFAFLQQSEVNLEMILQLNLYIMKQIPYLHLKIVYHLFYSIDLELKLMDLSLILRIFDLYYNYYYSVKGRDVGCAWF